MAEIVVLGSLNMDLSVNVPRIPRPGETISGGDLTISAGGKGANQAAACARLGRQVQMVGRVGSDDFGLHIKEGLQVAGVDVTYVTEEPGTPTGTAMILVDGKGENCIVLSAGANRKVTIDSVTSDLIKNASLLLLQLEIAPEVVYAAVDIAHEAGVIVLLNAAPAIPLPETLYPKIDYLIVNEIEAALLAGVQVTDHASAERAAKILLQFGAKNVMITLGASGALLTTPGKVIHISALKIKAVDTTGAGDAFIGGFASSLVTGEKIEQALEIASAAGALAAMKPGAQSSLPTQQELQDFLKKQDLQEVLS